MSEAIESSAATVSPNKGSSNDLQKESASTASLVSPRPLNPEAPVPYTTFTKRQKRFLTIILTVTMLASPLTATIYLPLLPLLSTQFKVSIQAINLTITLYIIFQAISPLFFATASDHFGRRPIYLATYTLYTAASLGLALNQHSYAGLLLLRALQSLGASAVLAVAFGVAADVCPPAERGTMLGPTQGAANLAVCLGPVIGGLVALGSKGFVWVFWALVIFGGTVLGLVGMALPETARNVVGNGSLKATGWGRTWWSIITIKLRKSSVEQNHSNTSKQDQRRAHDVDVEKGARTHIQRSEKFKMVNPLACIKIIFWKDTALVLWQAPSPYAVWYCVQTSIPKMYKDTYGFNELEIGLAYLTGGAGVVLGGYVNGKMMDRNYRATARKIGHTIDTVSGDDLDRFPIEKARARGSWYLLAIYICVLAGYGWSVVAQAHESVPLILQFVLAGLCTCFQQTFNALLVDIFPASPSTAAASSNITRCALSAVAVAILQPLVSIMGRGWFFTLLAITSGGGGLAANWAITTHGMHWRQQRILGEKKLLERLRTLEKSSDDPVLSSPAGEKVISKS
ncbi:MAG: hypothetical protein Q9190_005796 [Brigantiaea leucoxantha]